MTYKTIETEQDFRDNVQLFNTDIAVTTVYESNAIFHTPAQYQRVDTHVRLVHKSVAVELEAEIGDILIIAPIDLVNIGLNSESLNIYLIDQNMVLGYIKAGETDYRTIKELEDEENTREIDYDRKLRFLSNMSEEDIRSKIKLFHTNMIVESAYDKDDYFESIPEDHISAVGKVVHKGPDVISAIDIGDYVYLHRGNIMKMPLPIKGTHYRFIGSTSAIAKVEDVDYESAREKRERFGITNANLSTVPERKVELILPS